jgi:hypothetical protein
VNEAVAELGMSDSGQNVREWRREVNRKSRIWEKETWRREENNSKYFCQARLDDLGRPRETRLRHKIRRLTGGSTKIAVLNGLKRAGRGKGTDQEKADTNCSEVVI